MSEEADQQVQLWKIRRVSVAFRQPSINIAPIYIFPSAAAFLLLLRRTLTFFHSTSCLQLIKMLDEAKGNGTSMISLILPPRSQVSFLSLFSFSQHLPFFHTTHELMIYFISSPCRSLKPNRCFKMSMELPRTSNPE